MSIDRQTDKEDVVRVYKGILVGHQNNEMPSSATCMDLEIIILSEVSQTTNTVGYHLYVESKI